MQISGRFCRACLMPQSNRRFSQIESRSLSKKPFYGVIKTHRAAGAGYAPPAVKHLRKNRGLVRRGGIYAARCSRPDITIYRVNRAERSRPFPTTCRKFAFSRLLLIFRLFVGRGLDPSLPFCGNCKTPRRGEVTPPYGAIKNHCTVGAGHAPPVATIQKLRYIVKNARASNARPYNRIGKLRQPHDSTAQ